MLTLTEYVARHVDQKNILQHYKSFFEGFKTVTGYLAMYHPFQHAMLSKRKKVIKKNVEKPTLSSTEKKLSQDRIFVYSFDSFSCCNNNSTYSFVCVYMLG